MRWYAKCICWWAVVWLLCGGSGWGQEGPSEYQLKAAFLFNFVKFIEWPPEAFTAADSPMVIGVLGDDPFHGDLERTILNKTVNQRAFAVKQFGSATEAKNCQVLFISSSEVKKLPDIFQTLKGSSVLTVGETNGFIEAGGMINFVRQGKKFHFQINDDAAKKAKLKISSKLLELGLH